MDLDLSQGSEELAKNDPKIGVMGSLLFIYISFYAAWGWAYELVINIEMSYEIINRGSLIKINPGMTSVMYQYDIG